MLWFGAVDKWNWKFDSDVGFSVSGIYHMLSNDEHVDDTNVSNVVWIKYVPMKVSLFSCLLLNDMIPTKDNFTCYSCGLNTMSASQWMKGEEESSK